MSTQGSKYINKEIQNAVQGVKEIKTLIEKTNAERKSLLSSLEEAKKKKEVGTSLDRALALPAGGEEGVVVGRGLVGCHGVLAQSLQGFAEAGLDRGNREGTFASES